MTALNLLSLSNPAAQMARLSSLTSSTCALSSICMASTAWTLARMKRQSDSYALQTIDTGSRFWREWRVHRIHFASSPLRKLLVAQWITGISLLTGGLLMFHELYGPCSQQAAAEPASANPSQSGVSR